MEVTEHELDLRLAAQLQKALLPTNCPLNCPHQVAAARNRMCGSVGGDFYDFISLNDEQAAIVIGDVVGHGVQAALLMAQIMGFLRSTSEDMSRPARVLARLNEMLIDLGVAADTVLLCSVLYTVIDAPTGIGFLCNGGHPRAFLCNRDQCSVLHLGPHDMMLGVEPFTPVEACHTFQPGQRLVVYTDGIIDAMNSHAHRFGEERLADVLCQHSSAQSHVCAEAVMDAVEHHRAGAPQRDDETIVVIDRI